MVTVEVGKQYLKLYYRQINFNKMAYSSESL